MKKILLLLSYLSITSTLFSQNWELFQAGETYNFNENDIHSIKVDSTLQDSLGTSYYYFNYILNDSVYDPSLRWGGVTLKNILKPNILGKRMIKSNDSIFFLNEVSDKMLLLPFHPIDTSWIFFSDGNLNYYAKIDSVYQDSINGQLDSLKTISFIAKNLQGQIVNNSISSNYFVFSKNFGIKRCFNFYTFGRYYANSRYPSNYVRTLFNNNIPIAQLYDYNVGDEYHLQYNTGNASALHPPDYYNYVVVSKVLSLNGLSATISWRRVRQIRTASVNNNNFPPTITVNTHYRIDTISETINNWGDSIEYLGFTPQLKYDSNGVVNKANLYHLSINNYNGRLRTIQNDFLIDSIINPSNTWIPLFLDYIPHLIEGVCTYSEFKDYTSNPNQEWYVPLYFKKGTETWGTPRIVTGINTIEDEKEVLQIYPNPTTGTINISTDKKIENIAVYDMQGRISTTLHMTAYEVSTNNKTIVTLSGVETQTIELPEPKGIYLLQFQFKDGKVRSEKVIKQ